jgi:hypothetical protein
VRLAFIVLVLTPLAVTHATDVPKPPLPQQGVEGI